MSLIKYIIVIGVLLATGSYLIEQYYAKQVVEKLSLAAKAEKRGDHNRSKEILAKLKGEFGRHCVDFLIVVIHDEKQKSLRRLLAQRLLQTFKRDYNKKRSMDESSKAVFAALEKRILLDEESLSFMECVDYCKSNDAMVRVAAVRRLGQLRKKDGVRHVEQLLDDDYWKVRKVALEALVQIDSKGSLDKMIPLKDDGVPEVANAALLSIGVLAKGSSKANMIYEILVEELEKNLPAACSGLAQLGDSRALKVIESKLDHRRRDYRIEAARALVELGSPKGLQFLQDQVQSAREKWRCQAAIALGRSSADGAVDSLIAALSDRSAKVREAAAEALGKHRGPRVVAALKSCLTDKVVEVRAAAIISLGAQGDARVLPILEEHLKRGNPTEVEAAIRACEIAEHTEVVDILEELLKSKFKKIRISAWRALKKLTGHDYIIDFEAH